MKFARFLLISTTTFVFVGAALHNPTAALAEPAAATEPTTAPTSAPATTVSWEDAAKHVGETVTITGPVMGTHTVAGGKRVVLNVGKDFPDKTRFSVLVTLAKGGGPGEAATSQPDVDATYVGKTISVTGKVEMYKDVPEIKAKVDEVTVQN